MLNRREPGILSIKTFVHCKCNIKMDLDFYVRVRTSKKRVTGKQPLRNRNFTSRTRLKNTKQQSFLSSRISLAPAPVPQKCGHARWLTITFYTQHNNILQFTQLLFLKQKTLKPLFSFKSQRKNDYSATLTLFITKFSVTLRACKMFRN